MEILACPRSGSRKRQELDRAAIGGEEGGARATDILSSEVRRNMGPLETNALSEMHSERLLRLVTTGRNSTRS
jgi:hypothetical protein